MRYENVLELVRSRKATNAKRKVFVRLRETLPFLADLLALFMLFNEDCTWNQLITERVASEEKRIEQEKIRESIEKERQVSGGIEKREVTLREHPEEEGGGQGKEDEGTESDTYKFARKLMDTVGRALYYVNDNSWVRRLPLPCFPLLLLFLVPLSRPLSFPSPELLPLPFPFLFSFSSFSNIHPHTPPQHIMQVQFTNPQSLQLHITPSPFCSLSHSSNTFMHRIG